MYVNVFDQTVSFQVKTHNSKQVLQKVDIVNTQPSSHRVLLYDLILSKVKRLNPFATAWVREILFKF